MMLICPFRSKPDLSLSLPPVPLPAAGVLRITDITHSSMRLNWDAAPGAVRKYIITYKPEDGELKEVQLLLHLFHVQSWLTPEEQLAKTTGGRLRCWFVRQLPHI